MGVAAWMYRGVKLKAFCLAFAFLLTSLPAKAEELPQTGNAWRATEPGKFQWTVIDDAAGGASAPAAVIDEETEKKSAPARAALAQIRAETQRVLDAARQTSTKVSRIRYDLRVRCIVEQVEAEPQGVSAAGVPFIWNSQTETSEPASGTIEVCEVDYSQKVRSRPQDAAPAEPERVDFKVAFPVD